MLWCIVPSHFAAAILSAGEQSNSHTLGETQLAHAIYFTRNVAGRHSDTAPREDWITTYEIIGWCETHGLKYQIMYPLEAISYGKLRAWTCAFFQAAGSLS